jgi:putative DNA-invertase from lambdoid prophage Rac
MSRLFFYGRVSTLEQSPENQLLEIEQAGYIVDPKRVVLEKISGSVPADARPGYKKLKERLESSDIFLVSKLDRLGRDSVDLIRQVQWFKQEGIKLIVLQLGNLDLTSQAGSFTLKILAAVADYELGLIRERSAISQQRAWMAGKTKGRPSKTNEEERKNILQKLSQGVSVSQLARDYKISRASVIAIKKTIGLAGI